MFSVLYDASDYNEHLYKWAFEIMDLRTTGYIDVCSPTPRLLSLSLTVSPIFSNNAEESLGEWNVTYFKEDTHFRKKYVLFGFILHTLKKTTF